MGIGIVQNLIAQNLLGTKLDGDKTKLCVSVFLGRASCNLSLFYLVYVVLFTVYKSVCHLISRPGRSQGACSTITSIISRPGRSQGPALQTAL